MSEVVDMTNCKIGMLTVLYRTSNDTHGKAVWHCRCECGNEKDISGASLRNKSTLSCGCSHRSHNTFDLSGDYYTKRKSVQKSTTFIFVTMIRGRTILIVPHLYYMITKIIF